MTVKVKLPPRSQSVAVPEAPQIAVWQPAPDPFPYGWRIVSAPDSHGESIDYLPLTAADFLDPQLTIWWGSVISP